MRIRDLLGKNQFQSFLLSDCSKLKHEEYQNISPHLTDETIPVSANVLEKSSRRSKMCNEHKIGFCENSFLWNLLTYQCPRISRDGKHHKFLNYCNVIS